MLIIFMYNNNKTLLVLNDEPQLHLVDLSFCPYVFVSLALNIVLFFMHLISLIFRFIRQMSFSFKASSETFITVNVQKNWTEAQSYCRHNHTDLASVRNQSENNEIKDIINQNQISRDGAWICLSRLWVWSDNSTSTFTHWYTDEPNINQNREDVCTAIDINQHQGRWVDDPCTARCPFVCYDGE